MKKTRTRENDAVFFMLLGLTAVFFCWRCRYGFAEADEAFYPTIAYRLTQGDRLLVDEWHMSQLSSVLLYLPVLLFTRLTGGTAGIYLALRYLYVAVQCLVAATVYLRLRRYHSLGAAAGALALAVYAPYGINALSYNSLGILLMAMTGALLVPAEEESRAAYILAGLSFAGSVLCCPYLIAVYLLYALFVFIPRKKKKLPAFYPRPFGLFTLGAAGLAIVFFFVGLAGADLSRLDEILKGIFSDPAHPERTSLLKSVCQAVMDYPRFVFYHGYWRPGACMVLVLLMIPAALLDKHRERHAPAYFLIGTILTIAAEVLYVSAWNVPNFMMYAANVLALLCFFIAPGKSRNAPALRFPVLAPVHDIFRTDHHGVQPETVCGFFCCGLRSAGQSYGDRRHGTRHLQKGKGVAPPLFNGDSCRAGASANWRNGVSAI